MLLISLMTALIGISGCAAAEKASQTKAEAAQMGVKVCAGRSGGRNGRIHSTR